MAECEAGTLLRGQSTDASKRRARSALNSRCVWGSLSSLVSGLVVVIALL
jgi:hypothetical protein